MRVLKLHWQSVLNLDMCEFASKTLIQSRELESVNTLCNAKVLLRGRLQEEPSRLHLSIVCVNY